MTTAHITLPTDTATVATIPANHYLIHDDTHDDSFADCGYLATAVPLTGFDSSNQPVSIIAYVNTTTTATQPYTIPRADILDGHHIPTRITPTATAQQRRGLCDKNTCERLALVINANAYAHNAINVLRELGHTKHSHHTHAPAHH